MANALDVVGQLMVEMGGASASVEATGDTIAVDLPDLGAARSILRRWPGGRGRREAIRRIHEGLVGAGLRLEVRVASRTVGLLGVGARAGLVSRVLGLAPMQLMADGLLGARRKPVDRPER